MFKNKLKITKYTPMFIIVPFFVQFFVKFVGYKYIDYQMESRKIYEKF